MPPPWRNHRDPTGADTPQASAASSLDNPSAILVQNRRSISRRTGGRPGDRIGGLPVTAVVQPGGRPIHTPVLRVLRRPVESAPRYLLTTRWTPRDRRGPGPAARGLGQDAHRQPGEERPRPGKAPVTPGPGRGGTSEAPGADARTTPPRPPRPH